MGAVSKTSWLDLVAKFHDNLGDYYHDITHAHYGADHKHKAWEKITWLLQQRDTTNYEWPNIPPSEVTTGAELAQFVKSNGQGKITIKLKGDKSNYHLCGPDAPGDGTVPECSGYDSAIKAKFATKMKGYDHQDSYTKKAVKDVTTYSVMRIAMGE